MLEKVQFKLSKKGVQDGQKNGRLTWRSDLMTLSCSTWQSKIWIWFLFTSTGARV